MIDNFNYVVTVDLIDNFNYVVTVDLIDNIYQVVTVFATIFTTLFAGYWTFVMFG